MALLAIGGGPSKRARLFASRTVQALPKQIRMAVMPGILLDHVGQDPAEREPLATPTPPRFQCRGRGDQGARVVAFRLPHAEGLVYISGGCVAERGSPVPGWREDGLHFLSGEHRPKPVAFDFGHVPDDSEQRQARRRYGTLA